MRSGFAALAFFVAAGFASWPSALRSGVLAGRVRRFEPGQLLRRRLGGGLLLPRGHRVGSNTASFGLAFAAFFAPVVLVFFAVMVLLLVGCRRADIARRAGQ